MFWFIFYHHSNREDTFVCLLSEDWLSKSLKWGTSSPKTIITVSISIQTVYIHYMFKRTRLTNETTWIYFMWDHNVTMFFSYLATFVDIIQNTTTNGVFSSVLRKQWENASFITSQLNLVITHIITESGNYS